MSHNRRKHITAALLSSVACFAVVLVTADASLPFVHDVLFNGERSAAQLVNFTVSHTANQPPASQVMDQPPPPPAPGIDIWQAAGGNDIAMVWPTSPVRWGQDDNIPSATQNPTFTPGHGPAADTGGAGPFGGSPMTYSYNPPLGSFGFGGGGGGGGGGGPGAPGNSPGAPGHGSGAPGNGPGAPGNGPSASNSGPGAPGNGPGDPGNGPGAPGNGPGDPGPGPSDTGPIFGQPPPSLAESAPVLLDDVPAQVPEPASLLLFGTAILGLGITTVRRRRRQS